ncbi:MAG: molybdopterin molybdotransferase MoeA [Spirochaetales bacterium]|nr:molybdopterin molybdotransferase MoeA [Spirochaetales bacterium]
MLDFDAALEVMLSVEPNAGIETVSLEHSLGRILSEEIRSRIELPPFSKAAMDGFAVQSHDNSAEFEIVETIPAGGLPTKTIWAGKCSSIMTGAMMPPGADKVVRVEYTSVSGLKMKVIQTEPNGNVIQQGENVRPDSHLVDKGEVRRQHIGILAEQGIHEVAVRIPPLVGIIATGSELRDPGEELSPGQIFNSNGLQLCAQVANIGGKYRYYGIVADTRKSLIELLETAAEECDVVILSGGVSMGEYDYVPSAVAAVGAKIRFHKVAVKPGKPMLFASRDDTCIVGLPGNPVSTFVIFEVMVRPLIYRLMGITEEPILFAGNLAEEIRRRDLSRVEFRPVLLKSDQVIPVTYHGSSHLQALSTANGLLRIEKGIDRLAEGSRVDVRQI